MAKTKGTAGSDAVVLVVVAVFVLVVVGGLAAGCVPRDPVKLAFGCEVKVSEKSKTQSESLQNGDGRDGRADSDSVLPGVARGHGPAFNVGFGAGEPAKYAGDAPGAGAYPPLVCAE